MQGATNRREHFFFAGLVCLALFLPPSIRAQISTGTFTGTVTDPTGAAIPSATVSVTNIATNVTTSQQTRRDGIYTILNLRPGIYDLRASARGFRDLVNSRVELTVGANQRVDFHLEVGAANETVTVEGEAPAVNTEDIRISELVTARQVQNLPLNGRNVFQMVQLAPGAINVTGVMSESAGNRGFYTVVNGTRPTMQGYLLDGVTDKDLSGGSNTQPSVDTVQEFRVDTENMSAEYGSVAGAVTSLVTKSGTNDFHGDLYEFFRNDKLDAREFFEDNRHEFRMNQFGGTIGGPIKKDKIFFFGSYEGERTRVAIPEREVVETSQWRDLVMSNAPNSVAALLYKNFPGPAVSSNVCEAGSATPTNACSLSLADYVVNASGNCNTLDADCLTGAGANLQAYHIDPNSNLGKAILANPDMPMLGITNAAALLHSRDQFYTGNQWSAKLDWQADKDKIYGRFFFDRTADPFYTPATNGGLPSAFSAVRGFQNAAKYDYPSFAFSWTHSFSPKVLNDFRAGYSRSVNFDVSPNASGVPQITIDTGEVQFGSYNGYPQLFHENIFHYSDMVTISHGKHTIKAGGDLQRNYENSEFNVARPSYEFIDSIALTSQQVEAVAAGVDPGQIDPTTGQSLGQAHLASNIRAWRNWEFGAFVNDDWKVTPRLSLTLGLRYDLYTRHTEKYGQLTQLVLPDGANLTERIRAINCYEDISGAMGYDGKPCNGGFTQTTDALATGDHNNFGPRVGFAYDVRGDGRTSLRGGFGVSYQGEIYNPLSNSRWNPPFYSFNLAFCSSGTNPGEVSSALSDACIFGPVDGSAPTYTGPPTNLGHGPASATFNAFQGNIIGWYPYNANAAFLTGIVLPNFRDPYIYGAHLSLEHEFAPNLVLRTSWVGTFGHKLYRSEDINRQFAGKELADGSGPQSNGQCGLFGPYRVNCLYGRLRTWENSVNSNYEALQVVLDKRMSHGLEIHANYVYSHALDGRSTWHSGSTTSNGSAEGFSMDQANPGLDYGNAIFDLRHTFTASWVWQLPWFNGQPGFAGHVLGGWQINGAVSAHGGFPWTPHCSDSSFPGGATSCDFNGDGVRNDRPNQPSFGNSNNSSRAAFEPDHPSLNLSADQFLDCSVSPAPACSNWTGYFNGNLGRNTFHGPDFRDVDLSLFKNIKVSERVNLQFRAESFNLFNRTNLKPPGTVMTGNGSDHFGLSYATYQPREIQFALKLFF
jgi:hypothetical protein